MKYIDYLKNLKDCPFCDVSKVRIFENENAFLTYSAAPYHPDHLLVIPKRHVEHILDLNQKEVADIDLLQEKGLRILNNLGYKNMCVLVKEGDINEKSIAHTHYHIIPDVVLRDADHSGIDREVLSDAQVTELVSRVKSVII